MKHKFTFRYPISANDNWRPVVTPPSRNHYARLIKTPEAAEYARAVHLRAVSKLQQPVTGDISLQLDFYRPRKVGDLDNLQKVLLDAMTGAVYIDDKQINRILAIRHDTEPENPRAVVRVWTEPQLFGAEVDEQTAGVKAAISALQYIATSCSDPNSKITAQNALKAMGACE